MVKLISHTAELSRERQSENQSIGFVPTMGNLHQGHLSLLRQALEENEIVYFSIFVNPKQFGPQEDFNTYPRTLTQDISLIELCQKEFPTKRIKIFAPQNSLEIFPHGFDQSVSVTHLSQELEGKFRPGHFDGVASVVHRLFELIKPDRSYFGLKDFQQFLVIKNMAQDLMMPIQIVGLPTIREPSGLALSSRNQYLSPQERQRALALRSGLKQVAEVIQGKREKIVQAREVIKNLLQDKNWNYLEIRDAQNLSKDLAYSKKIVLLGVYQLGTTRLLDNIEMEIE